MGEGIQIAARRNQQPLSGTESLIGLPPAIARESADFFTCQPLNSDSDRDAAGCRQELALGPQSALRL